MRRREAEAPALAGAEGAAGSGWSMRRGWRRQEHKKLLEAASEEGDALLGKTLVSQYYVLSGPHRPSPPVRSAIRGPLRPSFRAGFGHFRSFSVSVWSFRSFLVLSCPVQLLALHFGLLILLLPCYMWAWGLHDRPHRRCLRYAYAHARVPCLSAQQSGVGGFPRCRHSPHPFCARRGSQGALRACGGVRAELAAG